MKHLLTVQDLSVEAIEDYVTKAIHLFRNPDFEMISKKKDPVALVFLENSTRTRCSFERASQLCGRPYSVIDSSSSSIAKSESLEDTFEVLKAYDASTFVVRTSDNEFCERFSKYTEGSIVNAGSGQNAHPTQALLDLATLVETFGGFAPLKERKIAIVGDIAHSRVARSWQRLAALMDLNVLFVGPDYFKPDWGEDIQFETSLSTLSDCEVVMGLRIQKERLADKVELPLQDYVQKFQISSTNLAGSKLLMHPGPVNWGIELASSLKEYEHSLIKKQVRMGLMLRTALLCDF